MTATLDIHYEYRDVEAIQQVMEFALELTRACGPDQYFIRFEIAAGTATIDGISWCPETKRCLDALHRRELAAQSRLNTRLQITDGFETEEVPFDLPADGARRYEFIDPEMD